MTRDSDPKADDANLKKEAGDKSFTLTNALLS